MKPAGNTNLPSNVRLNGCLMFKLHLSSCFFFYGPFLTSTTMSASSPVHLKYLRALCAYQEGSFSDSTCSVGILRRIIQVWLWSEGGLPRGTEWSVVFDSFSFFLFLSFSFLSFFFFSTFLFSKHPSTTMTSIVSRKETRRSCFDAGIDENNIFQEQRQRLGNRDAPQMIRHAGDTTTV